MGAMVVFGVFGVLVFGVFIVGVFVFVFVVVVGGVGEWRLCVLGAGISGIIVAAGYASHALAAGTRSV